jgi:hypothetical protein
MEWLAVEYDVLVDNAMIEELQHAFGFLNRRRGVSRGEFTTK